MAPSSPPLQPFLPEHAACRTHFDSLQANSDFLSKLQLGEDMPEQGAPISGSPRSHVAPFSSLRLQWPAAGQSRKEIFPATQRTCRLPSGEQAGSVLSVRQGSPSAFPEMSQRVAPATSAHPSLPLQGTGVYLASWQASIVVGSAQAGSLAALQDPPALGLQPTENAARAIKEARTM